MADNTFLIKLGMNTQELVNGANKANSVLSNLQSTIRNIGIGISAIQIGRFVMDISRLAGEAEGVRAAFNKLPESIKLMRDLKEATGGTVSELELMKRSVMASNFDISLKALPQLLEFATLRARQTGQSVNYLVDSIVTGIGRKSKLILDNLGISAVQLTEALGGASAASSTIGEVAEAVGRIASENLKKMGSLTDDAAVKADRLAASWENLKVTIGTAINNVGGNKVLEAINFMLGGGGPDAIQKLQQSLNEFNGNSGRFNDGSAKMASMMKDLQKQAKEAGVDLQFLTESSTNATKAFIKMPKKNQVWIDGGEVKEQVKNIAFFEDKIKSLNEEIKLTGKQSDIKRWQKEIIDAQKEIDKLMGKVEKFNEYQKRYDALQRKLALKPTMDLGDASHFATTKDEKKIPIDANEAFHKTQEALSKRLEETVKKNKKFVDDIKEQAMQVGQAYAAVGDAIGQGLGAAISGTESFAQAMIQMASQVVAALERIVLARMIEKSFQEGGPTPVAIALAAVGFGAVKALFNRIGRSAGSSGGGGGASSVASGGSSRGQFNLVAQVSGRDLKFIMSETGRNDSRTNTVR